MDQHITTCNQTRPMIDLPRGVRIPQYSGTWIEAVTSGRNVVDGNLFPEEETSE